jgi:hypothetical protein
MRPALRLVLTLGARGLGGVGAAAARAAIVGTVALGFWPLLAAIGRRMGTPSRG